MTLICPLPPAELSTVEASCQGHSVTTGEREVWFACNRTEPTQLMGMHEGGRLGEPAGLFTGHLCF